MEKRVDPFELHQVERRQPILPKDGEDFELQKGSPHKEWTKELENSSILVSWIAMNSLDLEMMSPITLFYLTLLPKPWILKDPINIEYNSWIT